MAIKTQNNEIKQLLELFGMSSDPIIGVDIGSSAVKIMELGKQNSRYVIQNFAIEPLNVGDVVAVEASPGHDIGVVSITGELVKLQLKKNIAYEKKGTGTARGGPEQLVEYHQRCF